MNGNISTRSELLLRSTTNALCPIVASGKQKWQWKQQREDLVQFEEIPIQELTKRKWLSTCPTSCRPNSATAGRREHRKPPREVGISSNTFRAVSIINLPWSHSITSSDLLPTCSGGSGRKRTPPPSLLRRCWSKQPCWRLLSRALEAQLHRNSLVTPSKGKLQDKVCLFVCLRSIDALILFSCLTLRVFVSLRFWLCSLLACWAGRRRVLWGQRRNSK